MNRYIASGILLLWPISVPLLSTSVVLVDLYAGAMKRSKGNSQSVAARSEVFDLLLDYKNRRVGSDQGAVQGYPLSLVMRGVLGKNLSPVEHFVLALQRFAVPYVVVLWVASMASHVHPLITGGVGIVAFVSLATSLYHLVQFCASEARQRPPPAPHAPESLHQLEGTSVVSAASIAPTRLNTVDLTGRSSVPPPMVEGREEPEASRVAGRLKMHPALQQSAVVTPSAAPVEQQHAAAPVATSPAISSPPLAPQIPPAGVHTSNLPAIEDISSADQATSPGPFRGKDWRSGAFDVPCVGGACLAGLCVIAALAAFSINVGLGTFMLLLSVLLFGNFLAPTPSAGFCGVICRVIIIVVAAVVGAFSGSVLGDAGVAVHLVNTSGHSSLPPAPPQYRYAACDHKSNGLSPLDLCVLSMVAYSNDSYAADDVASWFAPVGANATVIASDNGTSSLSGLRFRVYNVSSRQAGTESSVVVAVRGTQSANDAVSDLQLWNSAFLFQSLSSIGPCKQSVEWISGASTLTFPNALTFADGSFPIAVQQLLLSTVDGISDMIMVAMRARRGCFVHRI